MKLSELERIYKQHHLLQHVTDSIQSHAITHIKGILGSARSLLISALFGKYSHPLVIVMPDEEEAGYFYHDLVQIRGAQQVLFFPSAYKRAVKYGQLDTAGELSRIEALSYLQSPQSSSILVTYPEAIAERVATKDFFLSQTMHLSVGQSINSLEVAKKLHEHGFEQTDYVYDPGQYAIRGGILDVFSFSNEHPYRIDFFGDEIDSIRSFEVDSQLSIKREQEVVIIPQIAGQTRETCSLFELFSPNTTVVYEKLDFIANRIDSIFNDKPLLNNPEYDPEWQSKLISIEEFTHQVSRFNHLVIGNSIPRSANTTITWSTALQPPFHKNFDLVLDSLHQFDNDGYKLFILSDSSKQIERLQSIFTERGSKISFTPINQALHEGFWDNELKICCFTDHQIFDRYHKYTLKSAKTRSGKVALSLKELQQFQPGDYIVHIDHGIGKFGGLIRMEVNGSMQEMIKLFYQNNDTLLVSIHSLHKISKYKGKEGEPPRIHKLGTGAWNTMKERTKKKVKDIARDLIILYAKRREEEGFKFSPDSFLQRELEASFAYEDTPDQVKATQEVKSDMESSRPMDRLICGDVGFGKTEVAIRAAFKAVCDGKQVAVLVPTTVLASQHYQTFTQRLKDFPCKIAYLSRAKKSSQIKETLQAVHNGQIDILIGTHRLVSKDVKFHDLGLIIIDEEQKFGVATKEKLKQLRTQVDTLTLTATPIPRTLQFSLMGARDLSTITTPPPNRHPIRTEIHSFDVDILREAIQFEMSRNGQVFVINNRVQNIQQIADTVQQAVPDARIAIGHGQMNPQELEQVIEDFSNHEYDVLVATSIVESGIDIPNANTIIVNNAQHFGLSDLHQFRGRVGRSNKKAFCYLLTPPLHTLSSEARRRLQAIENFSELGSGIHIAMQDLDIRGAGNMLGAEQSGFIADLGYETYQKILTEAIEELKNDEFSHVYNTANDGQQPKEIFVQDTQIDSDIELYIPATYVPGDAERISLYRELDNISDEQQITSFTNRLEDRFGTIPEETQRLLKVVRIKCISRQLGVEKIRFRKNKIVIFLVEDQTSPYYQSNAFEKILTFINQHASQCSLSQKNGKPLLTINNVNSIDEAYLTIQEINGITTNTEEKNRH